MTSERSTSTMLCLMNMILSSFFLLLLVSQMAVRVSHGDTILVSMVNVGNVSFPVEMACAFKYMGKNYAGIKFTNTNGACLPLTSSELAAGPPSTAYFAKNLVKYVYTEPPSNLEADFPVPVKVGAEFEIKVHGRSQYHIDLYDKDSTRIMLQISCGSNGTVLNSYPSGAWHGEETIDEVVTNDTETVFNAIVTSEGFEIRLDGVYMYTYNHTSSYADINRMKLASDDQPGSTMLLQAWRLPP